MPGDLDADIGEEVDLEITFEEEHVHFHVRGQVRWRRQGGGRRALLPGVGIEFMPFEQATQEQMLAFAHGTCSPPHQDREARRYGMHVEVRTISDGVVAKHTTDDLGEGGCFVLMETPLDVGAELELKLKAPGALFGWITIAGIVVRKRQDPGMTGVGVEFVFESERKRERVKKIVHVLRERMIRELRVKMPTLATGTDLH